MPNRIIHEKACESPTLDQLSDFAERLFWRMTTKADDYGRFNAEPQVVLARCFPRLSANRRTLRKVAVALEEWHRAGLVVLYRIGEAALGQLCTFEQYQRQRGSKPKYPGPDDPNAAIFPDSGHLRQLAATCGDSPRSAAHIENVNENVNVNENGLGGESPPGPPAPLRAGLGPSGAGAGQENGTAGADVAREAVAQVAKLVAAGRAFDPPPKRRRGPVTEFSGVELNDRVELVKAQPAPP